MTVIARDRAIRMNASFVVPALGNACVAAAAIAFVWPLQRRVWHYASQYPSDNRWVMPVLRILVPVWLLLMTALLCVTAIGGFDWLGLGRPALYALIVAASLSLTAVTFVFIGLYVRPGFVPRAIFAPGIYLVPFTTALLAVLTLNHRFAPAVPIQWLHWLWTAMAALSLVLCIAFVAHRLMTSGSSDVRNLIRRMLIARETKRDRGRQRD